WALDKCSFNQPRLCRVAQAYLEAWTNIPGPTPVPEPASTALATSALLTLGALVRRQRAGRHRVTEPSSAACRMG
ncbi:MAG: hypothetical protein VCE43_20680, partial [Myxococcota bacterium]